MISFNLQFLQLKDKSILLPMKEDTMQVVFVFLGKKKFLC